MAASALHQERFVVGASGTWVVGGGEGVACGRYLAADAEDDTAALPAAAAAAAEGAIFAGVTAHPVGTYPPGGSGLAMAASGGAEAFPGAASARVAPPLPSAPRSARQRGTPRRAAQAPPA
mmetsp:Transcript_28226/g.61864  ORF Transcript_28226/g.61864 Transcript_28226/m.61864 type:complete len:121 (+) Transcript_28226:250-612(+)